MHSLTVELLKSFFFPLLFYAGEVKAMPFLLIYFIFDYLHWHYLRNAKRHSFDFSVVLDFSPS
jgi:hypothetical protein